MYNNFSSKKTKKVISALLASALVVTSAPISAEAATTKVLGVNKTFTKTATKVSGLSKSEKKIVKVTVNKSKKKVTVKGLKPGKASFKIGSKSYTVKVGAVAIKKKSFATSMTAETDKKVTVTSSYGAKDTLKWSSSDKKVVKVKLASTKATSKKVATNRLYALAAGTATITVKSKNTGKSLKVKVTVKAKTTPTTAPTATATGGAVTPSVEPTANVTATPEATTSAVVTATPEVPSGSATEAPTAVPTTGSATTAPTTAPTATPAPATCGAITVTTNATGAAVKVISNGSVVATGVATNGVAVIPGIANGDYTVEVSQTGFNTASKAVTVKGDVSAEITLEVTKEFTATQIGRQTILITGEKLTNKAADYTLLKGSTSVAVDSVEVSADSKSATLKSASSNLSAGTYTLKFDKSEYTFTVEAEKVSKIELVGENLVLAPNTTTCASIGFKVLNQFGERTGATVNTTCTLAVNTNIKVDQCTKNADGKITVEDMVGNIIAGTTTGTIVIVDTETGVNVSKTVTVTAQSAVDSIKIAGLYKNYSNPNKAQKVENMTSDVKIGDYAVLVKAYDQYGNEDTTAGLFNKKNVTITPTGTTGITIADKEIEVVTVGDETYLAIPLDANSLVDGSTTLTIVGNTKGLLGTASITVTKPVQVSSLKISQSETLYNRTESEIAYVAKDSSGNDVTDFDTLNALGTGTDVFKVANGGGTFKWIRQKDGSAKLYFKPELTKDNASSETASTTITLTTSVSTNVDVANFTVYNSKKATAIVGFDSDVALAAIKGGNGKVTLKAEDFKVQDQYGNILSDTEFGNSAAIVTVEVDGTNKAFAAIDADDKEVQVASKGAVVFDLATANEAGKTKFKFALKDVKNSDYTVTMQSVDVEDVDDYEIGDFDTLYVDPTKDAAAGEPIALKVTGKIGSTTVSLTASDYNVVGTDHIEYVGNGKVQVKANKNGDLTIYEEGSTTKYGSKTETLEVIVKNEAGKSITKKIALSSIDPKADSVSVIDNKFTTAIQTTESVDAKDISGLLEVKNQYNTIYKNAAKEARVQFTNIPDEFTVANNNTTGANITAKTDAVSTASKTFTVGVKVTYASGLTFEDTLVVSVSKKSAVVDPGNAETEATLEKAKADAKAELEGYKSAADYTVNATALADAITTGKAAIDAATSTETVATALVAAKTAIDAIESNQTISDAKANAKSELASYKSAADYTVNATALTNAITAGETAIDDATSTATVATALAEKKSAIDAIESDQAILDKITLLTIGTESTGYDVNSNETINVALATTVTAETNAQITWALAENVTDFELDSVGKALTAKSGSVSTVASALIATVKVGTKEKTFTFSLASDASSNVTVTAEAAQS